MNLSFKFSKNSKKNLFMFTRMAIIKDNEPGVVAHASNPSTLRGQGKGITNSNQLWVI